MVSYWERSSFKLVSSPDGSDPDIRKRNRSAKKKRRVGSGSCTCTLTIGSSPAAGDSNSVNSVRSIAQWQGVHIWTPCENVLGEIATTRWEQILRLSFHSLNCSSIVHEIYHKMCAKYMLGPLYRLLCIIQSFKS